MKKIAVILSGCGHKDGAEITESVSTLLALSEFKAQVSVFGLNREFAAKNAVTGEPTGEKRNGLQESARITRGEIRDVSRLSAADFDGVALPGGFGAALNLCNWAQQGAQCRVDPEIERVIREFYQAQKPIAAICIAPALVARVLGSEGLHLTIGNDRETGAEIEKTGALHETCAVDDFITDREHRIITTPAYMYADAQPFEVYTGIRKALRELVEMA